MNIYVTKDYDKMSEMATDIFVKAILEKPNCLLGLATGSTPIGLYHGLVKAYKEKKIDFSEVRTVNLDEYYPISPENEQSYRYFMNKYLFDRININKANTFVPDGTAKDPEAFCREYESNIDAMGGIDLQLLGIGQNGHIGFNEPAQNLLVADTHLTKLTENTINANARFFSSVDEVPTHALTMGIRSIFKARKVVILATGRQKAEAVKKMVSGVIDTTCPATLLCLHPDVTLICDEAAYSLV